MDGKTACTRMSKLGKTCFSPDEGIRLRGNKDAYYYSLNHILVCANAF
jgi:hypothetical protein